MTDGSYIQLWYIQDITSYSYSKVKIVLFNISVKASGRCSEKCSLTLGL